MNLHKECLSCGEYFPAKPMEFKFFCDKKECQEKATYRITYIKKNRFIPTNYFDIYDLDRPIHHGEDKIFGKFERVCRICGKPLLRKKDGTYNYSMRYCREHNGEELWAKYNWGIVSKDYAYEIRDKNQAIIDEKLGHPSEKDRKYYNRTICEKCGKLCMIKGYWDRFSNKIYKPINIHHIIPVHTLDFDNLHLIWDKTNLICLCEECHNHQNHYLKQVKEDPFLKFKKITEFLV